MKAFLKMVAANLTALSIALGVCIMGGFFLMILFALVSANQPKPTVKDEAVLVVDLWMNISDAPPEASLGAAVNQVIYGPEVPRLSVLEVVDGIERAAQDDRIEALFLYGSLIPDNYGSGLAALREVREAIEHFKATGKPVYAYAIDPTMRDYYLMASADEVVLNPFGLLSINGLASEMMYFGQAFEKYGIGVQTTRVGKYKSAVEMFTGSQMSEPDKLQVTELLNDIWGQILADVASGRELDVQQLRALSNEQGFFTGQMALEAGLVDRVAYLDEVIDTLVDEVGYDEQAESFRQVALADYVKLAGFGPEHRYGGNQIAVVYAEGDIVDGEGFKNQVGGDRLARDLRNLCDDPDVAAIVLRVNSPGGSALASEVIQREMREARDKKPVIVSMGSLAASGGYWISAYSDRIFAEPTTITGSIGVFGLFFNVEDIAAEHGITFDGVKTSTYADLFTISRPKSEEEMALVQQYTDFLYDAFINKVAEGRDLSPEQVQRIAQGRVWSGEDALEIGLVDEIGGLGDAIRYAADEAGVADYYTVTQIPERMNFPQALERAMQGGGQQPPVAKTSADLLSQLEARLKAELGMVRSFNDPKGIYARLPFSLEIR
ncbi:signal peptide peptidase SppA [Ruficoccus sp. ZRK36]|uniref:signal peptide peptidase SppA n=1 Tax=Ruficoccus sp. ZRK36 TaxID=2866311 RepID=UPI001C7325C3|nr:signal peptide peptidase SppA [Ruficoccus sp. ZRK36]QYY36258.1 signal peptide peptidase SppA [Ruficoccus sp. ZRK36]